MVDPLAREFSEVLFMHLYEWRREDARLGAMQDRLAVALLRDNEGNGENNHADHLPPAA